MTAGAMCAQLTRLQQLRFRCGRNYNKASLLFCKTSNREMGTVTPPAIHTQTHTRDTQALTLILLINSADKDWLAPETPLSVCFSLCCDSQEIDEHTNNPPPTLATHTGTHRLPPVMCQSVYSWCLNFVLPCPGCQPCWKWLASQPGVPLHCYHKSQHNMEPFPTHTHTRTGEAQTTQTFINAT